MIQRMVTSAVFAGFAAGLLAALLHFVFVQKLILLAEDYESGALVHFAAAVAGHSEAGHSEAGHSEAGHSHKPANVAPVEPAASAETAEDHHHEVSAGAFSRNAWTSLMFGVAYVGYALLLVAGYGLAEAFGVTVSLRDGLLWGIAGFVAFQLAPAMGLEPELPGTMAADLTARQIWWLGTAVCTAGGLGLLGYGRGLMSMVGAVALLAVPHVIGAPELGSYSGVAPPELASAFAARSLGAGLAVWASMGALSARLWSGK